MSDIKNKIASLIETLTNELYNEYPDRPYPLASGNCGVFAASLSAVLTENNISHHFKIFSKRKRNAKTWASAKLLRVDGCHVVVCIDGTNFDCDVTPSDDDIKEWCREEYGCNIYTYHIHDMNIPSMIEYCSSETYPWIDADIFYNKIKNIFKTL